MAAEPAMQPHEAQAAAPAEPDATELHDHALQAEKHLEALATGLAAAHADPSAVKAVVQMADVMRQLLKALTADAQATAPPDTMDSATNSMTNDLRAKRQGA